MKAEGEPEPPASADGGEAECSGIQTQHTEHTTAEPRAECHTDHNHDRGHHDDAHERAHERAEHERESRCRSHAQSVVEAGFDVANRGEAETDTAERSAHHDAERHVPVDRAIGGEARNLRDGEEGSGEHDHVEDRHGERREERRRQTTNRANAALGEDADGALRARHEHITFRLRGRRLQRGAHRAFNRAESCRRASAVVRIEMPVGIASVCNIAVSEMPSMVSQR